MNYFFATILAFLSITAIGQKIFEGIVHYELTVKKDSAALVDMTAYFKKDKIKIVTTVRKTSEGMDLKNETIILNFKDAVIDRIKEEGKIIERERMSLHQKKQDIPDLSLQSSKFHYYFKPSLYRIHYRSLFKRRDQRFGDC